MSRLAEVGLEIAEAAGRRATAPQDDGDAGEPALSYARAARAVRLTIALQSRLLKDLTSLDRAESLDKVARRDERTRRIYRAVRRAIEAEGYDGDACDRLSSEAWEWLGDADDADLTGLAFDEIVARICADLGLSSEQSAQVWAGSGPESGTPVDAPADTASSGDASVLVIKLWPLEADPPGYTGLSPPRPVHDL